MTIASATPGADRVVKALGTGKIDSGWLTALTASEVAALLYTVTTVAPTSANDDKEVGHRWINTSTSREYVCTDNTLGTAVWVETGGNLTGPITSVGHVTSVAAQTGTGSTFVMNTSPTLVTPNIGAATATTLGTGTITITDAANITVNTTTGTKIGTATSQKLAFYNSTPIVQPSGDVATALSALGLVASPTIAATDVTLTTGQIGYGIGGFLSSSAGFAVVGTPSATAPSAATSGPGNRVGPVFQAADGGESTVTSVAFGNGAAQATGVVGYACQGTAASPGASILNDNLILSLRGHDGTAFTTAAAQIAIRVGSTWSNTNHEALIRFSTTPNASTSLTSAGQIDSNQCLVWGGAFNSVSTFSAGTQRPHIQTAATTAANANMAQSIWINSTAGATQIMAKSRSTTVGTQGVITTGDTLGTMSWQGDDGTNFINAADIICIAEGTIATGQIPGRMRFRTATSAGTVTQAMAVDSQQVVIIGNATTLGSTLYTGATVTPQMQVIGNTNSISGTVAISRFQATATAGSLYFSKSRSGTVGTMTVVTTGDTLGTIDWQGSDGTNFQSAAKIIVTVTGTVAGSRTPGNMVFQTGVDAAGSALTTALTITNAQVIQENGTTEASAVGTANVVNSGGLGVAKRSFLGTIGSTFKGNVDAGVQDATAAVAGQVGEVISSVVSTYTNYTTTGTIQQLTSIALTAGDWVIYASVTYYGNSATNATDGEFVNYLCDTTASATGAVEGETISYNDQPVTGTLHRTVTMTYHENIGASKTKYLNGKAAFSVGNPQFACSLKAVRIR